MKSFIVCGFLLALTQSACSAVINCESTGKKITISTSGREISITMGGETALADGIATNEEIDLVARFAQQGEVTIYARLSQPGPGNYVFIGGKRNPLSCR